ncbi:MAG: FAD-dependent monooxygenase [Bdellovibrionota bacterium]
MSSPQVLISGAGPTGLVLALYLAKQGIRIRVIDKAKEAGTTSRAVVVHARTLEFYQQLGMADEILKRGLKSESFNLWVEGKQVASIPVTDMGTGLSPFPYVLIFPQDEHEKLLIDLLEKNGITVERETELTEFTEKQNVISAKVKTADGKEEIIRTEYLAGCDGAHSKVRDIIHTGFPGGTYDHIFYVADVIANGPAVNGGVNVALDDSDFLGIFPMKNEGHARLIGTVIPSAAGSKKELSWDDVKQVAINRLKIKVEEINWFSTYKVHHRVTEHFQQGRAFVLGDAAHIHSPVGGQGMNTGIGDAVNLAWKLAAVLKKQAPSSLLASYEIERMEFAKQLVRTTDRMFKLVTSTADFASFARTKITPMIIPLLFGRAATQKWIFKRLSQIGIAYRNSPVSEGKAGLSAGERLPWVKVSDKSFNFKYLTSLNWQIHVYGKVRPEIAKLCEKLKIKLHVFPWQSAMGKVGLVEHAVYLIRPDGHIAFADKKPSSLQIERYLADRGFDFRPVNSQKTQTNHSHKSSGSSTPVFPISARPHR